jgi:hypothetical protein
VVEQRS